MTDGLSGSCLCGAVRYEVDGPASWCAHCHCSLCRRAHGAAFVTWVGVRLESFAVVEGEDRLRWYQSSATGRRGFCSICGTTLLFWAERWGHEMHLTMASLNGHVDLAPTIHAFYDRHVDWVQLGDSLPRRGGVTGTEPLQGE